MRIRSVTLAAVLSVLSLLSLVAAAPAGATSVSDPDDVSGKLDLETVTGTKADATAPLKITIETHENWAKRLLKDSGRNRVWVLFNVDSDPTVEYVGEIYEVGGKLTMSISGSGSTFENLPVRHPDGHTLKTTVPGSSPPNPDGTVRIAVKSRFKDTADCSTACRDRAPNGGWVAVA